MSRSLPGGSDCVVTVGLGMRRDRCAPATLLRSVSRRPASPAPAAMPAAAAPAARTRLTGTSSPAAPNSLMATFSSPGGVKPIGSSPTATPGDPLAPVTPATNCPAPSAAPAASNPAMAPRPIRRPSLPLMLMMTIRRGRAGGLLATANPRLFLLRISIVMDPAKRADPGVGAGTDLAALIRLVARGDVAAFDAVYDQVAASVFGIARPVIRDPAQSEEVTQDVLLQLWRTAANVH